MSLKVKVLQKVRSLNIPITNNPKSNDKKKKVLITGSNGFIAQYFKKKYENSNDGIDYQFLSIRNKDWEEIDFSLFDTVIHLAGLVHKNEKKIPESEYIDVNYTLTQKIADKAKLFGVKNFIFFSTFSVYGKIGSLNQIEIIDSETKPNPVTKYGKSKFLAEEYLKYIANDSFIVTILRIPMVYGENSPGNYTKLINFSSKIRVFPLLNNQRSAVHIDKLCFELIKIIKNPVNKILIIQDEEYINTSLLIKKEAKNKLYFSPILGIIIKKIGSNSSICRKVFGNLIYVE